MRKTLLSLSCFLALAASACTGPIALRQSTMEYNHAIRQTTDEQMLLNLVRLKYRDAPLFLETGSVSAQFDFKSSGSIAGTINENVGGTNKPSVLGLGGGVSFNEKPTITFTPLHGEQFVQRLMAPMDLDRIMTLFYAGWSADRILRLTVHRMNGIENALSASGPTPDIRPSYERFARVTNGLRELQKRGLLNLGYESKQVPLSEPTPIEHVNTEDLVAVAREGYRLSQVGDKTYVLMGKEKSAVLRIEKSAHTQPETREIVEEIYDLLNIKPGSERVALSPSFATGQPASGSQSETLSISTRSLLGTLFYLSQAVEIPQEHKDEGLVTITKDRQGGDFDWRLVTGNLLIVKSAKRQPSNAAVAVKYRDYWFYIEDSDLNSKSTFSLLGQLFGLQAGGVKTVAPVLTLPIGG